MNKGKRYLKVLKLLLMYYNISESEFIELLKKRENKYLLLLLLKEYKCIDEENLLKMLNLKSKKSISYGIKKAEEKLLINREFRDKFFELEENLLK